MFRFNDYLTEIDNVQKVRKESYGQELIVDLHNVHSDFFKRKTIGKFAANLCDEIKMKKGPLHIWGTDADEHKHHSGKDTDNEIKADGISCVQFLYNSSITIHALDEIQKVFINIFSCDKFDNKKAIAFINTFIQGDIVKTHNIVRG